MGKLKEFAQDLAEAFGQENIDDGILTAGQEILNTRDLKPARRGFKLMRISKLMRRYRFIHVCSVCKRYKSGDEWVMPILKIENWKIPRPLRIYPQGKQSHTFCPSCYNEFYKAEIEAGILTAV